MSTSLCHFPDFSLSSQPQGARLRRPSWLTVVLVIAAVVIGVYYVAVKGEKRSAFNRWRPMVLELVHGEDIYTRYGFPTPPIMGLILVPFAVLPGKLAMASWFLAKLAMTAASIAGLRYLIERPVGHATRLSVAWLAVALLLASRPISGDLLHGNINLWILFLIVAGLVAYRVGRPIAAGLILALAVACKLTPALLLAYFVAKRQTRVLFGAAIGLALWLLVVPSTVIGPTRNAELLYRWGGLMIHPYVVQGQVDTEQVNQSLAALYSRILTDSVAIEPDDDRPAVRINVIAIDPDWAKWGWRVVAVALLAALACVCRGPLRYEHNRWLHEISLVLLTGLLVSERSWKHHYVLALPSLLVLTASAHQAWRERNEPRARLLASLLGIAGLSMALTSPEIARYLVGPEADKLWQAYGAYVWSALALMVGHWVCLRDRREVPLGQATRPVTVSGKRFTID